MSRGPATVNINDALDLMARDPLGLLVRLSGEGDIVLIDGDPSLQPPTYLFSHPDAVREILVTHQASFRKGAGMLALERVLGEGLITSEGAIHRRQRRLIQPVFHRNRIASFGQTIVSETQQLRDQWRAGATVNVHELMTRLMLGIATEVLLGSDVQAADAAVLSEALSAVEEEFTAYGLPFSDVLEPAANVERLATARAIVDVVLYPLIERRTSSPSAGSDFISLMLNLRDADLPDGLNREQIRNEAIGLLLAGHVTTATALTWCWHLLASNPEARAQVEEEVDRIVGNRLPVAGDVPNLGLCESAIAESMRLYPPAWGTHRRALDDVMINGCQVPAGALVVISQYIIHRDPRWYPDPDCFELSRWKDEARAARPRYSYVPFGSGPRVCIGEPFAWFEGVLVLATIVQEWRLESQRNRRVRFSAKTNLIPKDGLLMKLVKRRGAEAPSRLESGP